MLLNLVKRLSYAPIQVLTLAISEPKYPLDEVYSQIEGAFNS